MLARSARHIQCRDRQGNVDSEAETDVSEARKARFGGSVTGAGAVAFQFGKSKCLWRLQRVRPQRHSKLTALALLVATLLGQ